MKWIISYAVCTESKRHLDDEVWTRETVTCITDKEKEDYKSFLTSLDDYVADIEIKEWITHR